jgi:20S proteasome alpha/beta subunit
MMALSGVAADGVAFSEYIQKNLKLYELNNDIQLDIASTANYIRGEVSQQRTLL